MLTKKGSVLIVAIGVLAILSMLLSAYIKMLQDQDDTNYGLFLSFKKMKMAEGVMEAYLGAIDALGTKATINSSGNGVDINPFVKDPNGTSPRYYDDNLITGFGGQTGIIKPPLHGGSWQTGDFQSFSKVYNQGCWQTIFLNYRISTPDSAIKYSAEAGGVASTQYFHDFINMAVGVHHPHAKANSLNSPVASPAEYVCPTGCIDNPQVNYYTDSTGREVPIYVFNYFWTNIDYTSYRMGASSIAAPGPAFGNWIEFNENVKPDVVTKDVCGALVNLYQKFPRDIRDSRTTDPEGIVNTRENRTWYYPDYSCDLRCWEDSVPWGKKKALYDEGEHSWPKWRRDSRNTGVAPVPIITTPVVQQIGAVGQGPGYIGPVIGGQPKKEVIYAGSGHTLIAIDMADPVNPVEKWRVVFSGGFEGTPLVGPNNTLVVGTDRWIAGGTPALALLDSQTGNIIWNVNSGQNGMDFDTGLIGSCVMDKGLGMMELSGEMRISIYCESYYAHVYSVDYLTGAKNWYLRTGNSDVASPCLSADDGTMYFATKYNSATNGVYAVSPLGVQNWFYCTTNNIQASSTISESGTIYQYVCDGYMHSFNPDGSPRWKIKVAAGSYCNGTMASPAYFGGKLYVRTFGEMVIMDDETGAIIKNVTFNNPSKSMRWYNCPSPCIASGGEGRVYICDNGGGLHCFDLDGTEKWAAQVSTVAGFLGSPALGWDGSVYVTDYSGNVFRVYDPNNK